jgi:hypothetical protein
MGLAVSSIFFRRFPIPHRRSHDDKDLTKAAVVDDGSGARMRPYRAVEVRGGKTRLVRRKMT